MNHQTNSSTLHNAKGGGSALSIGIGMLIGLIIALVVAYFAMSSGPFRDKSNKNVLTGSQQGDTDPNAPLYSKTGAPPILPNSAAPDNEQGVGASALSDTGAAPAANGLTPSLNEGNKNADANNSMAATRVAPAKKAQNDDAIADLITNKTKSKASVNESSSSSKSKAPASVSDSPKKPSTSDNPNTQESTPKVVTPVTANNKDEQ